MKKFKAILGALSGRIYLESKTYSAWGISGANPGVRMFVNRHGTISSWKPRGVLFSDALYGGITRESNHRLPSLSFWTVESAPEIFKNEFVVKYETI